MKKTKSPRICNTGVQNTLKSDFRACIDWLQATLKIDDVDQFITHVLGLEVSEFLEARGELGYHKSKILGGIRVYYEGTEDMGIHLKMTGQGCRQYEEWSSSKQPWSVLLGMFLDLKANFPRIDIAIDDFEGVFKIDQLLRKIKKGELISKFKQARGVESIEIATGGSRGVTIYYGSPTSDIQIRQYEKNHERENAGEKLEEGMEIWNRTEVQARNKRAQKIAEIIVSGEDVGKIVGGILKHYLRFAVRGKDTNRSRWKTAPFWKKFLSGVEALKLTEIAPDRTIEKTEKWLKDQVAPSLAALIIAYDGDMDKIYKLITSGKARLKTKDQEMIARFKRQNKIPDLGQDQGIHG